MEQLVVALEDLISQFNASILVASEWANLALLPSSYQDLGLVAKCAAQANSNLSVATQFKIDLESLLIESESNLSAAINKGENVSTLDYLKAELNSTQSADQKANAELRAATTNVESALKLVEVLLANTGDIVELPKKLISAIEAVSDATLTIQAASIEASDFPELAVQAAEQINSEIEKLDDARSELDTARADLLEAMQKMGSSASQGLSALLGLQINIGYLIEESQATLKAFQENDQTTHSFSQLEKFAEALQQIAAQAESSVEQDNILKASLYLRDQNSKMPEPTELIKTIKGVSLSIVADQYIIINGNSPFIPITINGQPASETNPGAGWKAIAVAPSKSGTLFELIWKNSNTGQFATWKLDANGALIKGDALSLTGLLDLEDNLGSDINDDKATGWNFQNGKQIQGLTLLTAQSGLAYAIQKSDGSKVDITYNNGLRASKENPGGGWEAIAVAPSKSGTQIELIWKNSNNGQFANWKLDNNGVFIKGDLLSTSGLLDLEDNLGSDINDDKATGWNFQNGKQIQGLTLLTAQSGLAYAIQKSDGSKVDITYNNGLRASKENPGGGWTAKAVTVAENGNYHLYWENKANPNSNLARWEVSSSGSYRDGKVLSESELNLDELNLQEDLNDDKRIGPFQKVEGTITPDNLTANPEQPFQVLYGRQAKDLLTSSSQNSLGFDLLIGGPGDDSYKVPGGTSALIVEQGNDPLDELIAASINTSRSKFATLELGRHLGIFDQTSDTSLFIYDWQKQSNRIEVFSMQDRAYTFDQFKQAVIPAGQVLPDLTWGQWDQQFGIGHISHIGLAEGITLTKLAETYSTL